MSWFLNVFTHTHTKPLLLPPISINKQVRHKFGSDPMYYMQNFHQLAGAPLCDLTKEHHCTFTSSLTWVTLLTKKGWYEHMFLKYLVWNVFIYTLVICYLVWNFLPDTSSQDCVIGFEKFKTNYVHCPIICIFYTLHTTTSTI